MEKYASLELTLSIISSVLILKLLVMYMCFPGLFLRHPNQLYFCSLIFWVLNLILRITTDISLLRYLLHRSSNKLQGNSYLYYTSEFLFLMFYHYIVVLNLEIIIKISKASSQGYKKRVLAYHIFCTASSIIIVALTVSLRSIEINETAPENNRNDAGYNLFLWYIFLLSFGSWACVGVYFREMVKVRSKALYSLVLLTIAINLTIFLGFIVPEIAYYFELNISYSDSIFILLEVLANAAGGIFMYMALVTCKKRRRFMKSIFHQQRKKWKLRKQRKQNDWNGADKSASLMLIESKQSECGGLLADYFDNVTKEVGGM